MNVLSLFDGMSCGQIALNRLGIQYDNYFASEIDKYAIQITQKNYPKTVQLGDVRNVKVAEHIDLIFGGSPCQGFSFAGKQLNFDDPRSKLFFEFVRILQEARAINPDVKFLLENVKMKKESEDVISMYLGVKPLKINSSLVSAQNRNRLYWTNIPGVTVPEDRGIYIADILEENVPEIFNLSPKATAYMNSTTTDGRTRWDFGLHGDTAKGKSQCLVANLFKGAPNNVLIDRAGREFVKTDRKGVIKKDQYKAGCLVIGGNGAGNHSDMDVLRFEDRIRRYTPVECERLQTVPDNYTEGVSNSQRYRMIGNGWTVDVIAHIFANLQASQINKAA